MSSEMSSSLQLSRCCTRRLCGEEATYLWHAEPVSHILLELDPVLADGFNVAEEAQVDDQSLIDVAGHLAIPESVTVNLRVPGVRFTHGRVDLWVWVVEWERQWIVGVILLVLLDESRPAQAVRVVDDTIDDAALEQDLAECHCLLGHVAALLDCVISRIVRRLGVFLRMSRLGRFAQEADLREQEAVCPGQS
jgi:hypothetical protein